MCGELHRLLNNYVGAEVGFYEVLSVRGVFAHIKLKQFGNVVVVAKAYLFKTDALANKVFEFVWGDFTKPFKAGNLGIGPKFSDCLVALFASIAVDCLFFISHPK